MRDGDPRRRSIAIFIAAIELAERAFEAGRSGHARIRAGHGRVTVNITKCTSFSVIYAALIYAPTYVENVVMAGWTAVAPLLPFIR